MSAPAAAPASLRSGSGPHPQSSSLRGGDAGGSYSAGTLQGSTLPRSTAPLAVAVTDLWRLDPCGQLAGLPGVSGGQPEASKQPSNPPGCSSLLPAQSPRPAQVNTGRETLSPSVGQLPLPYFKYAEGKKVGGRGGPDFPGARSLCSLFPSLVYL